MKILTKIKNRQKIRDPNSITKMHTHIASNTRHHNRQSRSQPGNQQETNSLFRPTSDTAPLAPRNAPAPRVPVPPEGQSPKEHVLCCIGCRDSETSRDRIETKCEHETLHQIAPALSHSSPASPPLTQRRKLLRKNREDQQ